MSNFNRYTCEDILRRKKVTRNEKEIIEVCFKENKEKKKVSKGKKISKKTDDSFYSLWQLVK